MDQTIELEILGLSSNHSQSGSFTLVMGEVGGSRRLPIVIGMFEAQAIAIEIEKIIPNRPMTHDLFKSFSSNFNFSIDHILISDMREGVFYAKIVCKNVSKTVEIDARPSDAIAIAVRFDAPIFCISKVMSEAAIEFNEDDEKRDSQKPIKSSKTSTTTPKSSDSLKDFSLDKLNQMLDKAINNEDYEKAARIRDEINRRN
ncbi:bifunctional nuclease family protein [Aquiflexum gelatinilyticum]|uniref:Bifunctional nuclease family protein n=1 Tax=Aquiflexum gelatinilyticum TaxID=2961943 RepID=A0A9X2PBG5_9BACT|nr:bifunctional nuclease family protein [Aquiflexum gelatinilyticum]MCS4432915.1 bifunctional nuclease family protein [Aquiflexum gelatinilyticum]